MIVYAIKRTDGKLLNTFGSFFETSIKIWKTEKGCSNWFKSHSFVGKKDCKPVKVEIKEVQDVKD